MLIQKNRIEKYRKYIKMPLLELMDIANKVRKEYYGDSLNTCSIINAKSGKCSEDCKYCAQSSFYETGANVYDMLDVNTIVNEAVEADKNGAKRLGIVTSGKGLSQKDIPIVEKAVKKINSETNVRPCGSLGILDEDVLHRLKNAGLKRIHHNIETSESFYGNVVTTHTFKDRIDTIKKSQKIGFEVCSGGILGLGESWDDRIEMALILKDLKIDNVPLNFLNPIKGTPMENNGVMSIEDALRSIAIFRIILKDISLEVVAGREIIFKDSNISLFMAGANSMMIGGYLTKQGREVEKDIELLEDAKRMLEKL